MSKPTAADRLDALAEDFYDANNPRNYETLLSDAEKSDLLRNAAELVRACEEMDGGYNDLYGYWVSADEWEDFLKALAKLQGSDKE